MAFNAGAIEATLTLNRNPFTAGLTASRAQAKKFAEDEIKAVVSVRLKLEQGAAKLLREQIAKITGTADVKLKFAEGAVVEFREKISKITGTANAKLNLDKESAAALKEKIGKLFGTANVKLKLDKDSVADLKVAISQINGTANIDVKLAQAKLAVIEQQIKASVAKNAVAEVGVQIKEAQLRIVEERLRQLEDKRVIADIEFDVKFANLLLAEERLRQLEAKSAQIPIDFDIKAAKLLQLEEQMAQLEARRPEIEIDFDIKLIKLHMLEERFLQLEARRAEIVIDFDIKTAKLLQLEEQMLQLEMRRAEIPIDFDIKRVKLLTMMAQLEALEARRPEIEIDFDIKMAKLRLLEAQLLKLSTKETTHKINLNTGGSFRAMKILLALGPLLVPSIGSAIVAITGLLGGLTSAIGTSAFALAAFAGVGASVFGTLNSYAKDNTAAMAANATATRGVEDAQRNLATVVANARQSQVQAARQVTSAEEALTRAVEDGAEAQVAANRRVESAERQVATSKRALTNAHEDLSRAIRETREEMEDLELSLRGAALSEEQAVLDLAEAQERLAAARAEGITGNDLKQLELDVRRAALGIDEARERYGDLREESDEFARTGVEGSQRVRAATQGVEDATQGVRDAETELGIARADAAKVAADSARNIREANQDLDEAREASRQATIDAQRDIAEAERAVADARAEYARVQLEQVAALTPAMARAEAALRGVKDEYDALVKRTQDPVADAFTANFKAASAFLRTIDPIIVATSKSLEIIGGQIEEYFGTKHWKDFVDFLSQNIQPNLQGMFDIITAGTRVVMSLIEAFDPFADRLLPAISGGLSDFAEWIDRIAGTPEFNAWLELAWRSLEAFWGWLVDVVEFLFTLSNALAPLGNLLFDFFGGIFDGVASLPPAVLAALAEGLLAIVGAMILGAGGPALLFIGAIAALAAAFANLYDTNEMVRTAIDDFVGTITSIFSPVFQGLADLFEARVVPALAGLGDVVNDKLIPAIGDFLIAAAPFIAFFVDIVGKIIIDIFERFVKVITGLLEGLAGAFKLITGLITGDWELFWEGLQDIGKATLDIILGLFNTSLETLQEDFDGWRVGFESTWQDFWEFNQSIVETHNELVGKGWSTFLGDLDKALGLNRGTLEKNWNSLWTGLGSSHSVVVDSVAKVWNDHWALLIGTAATESSTLGSDLERFWAETQGMLNDFWTSIGIDWGIFWVDTNEKQATETDTSRKGWLVWLFDLGVGATNFWDDFATGWTAFWGGTKTEQGTSQVEIKGLWNIFWEDLGKIFSDWWNQMIADWNFFWNEVNRISGEAAVNIGNAFRAVGNFIRAPFQWVIDVIINKGIVDSWNAVMKAINAPALEWDPVPSLPMFAKGGPIKGGVPNRDSVPIMTMPGEYVLSKRAIENMGGLSRVDQMHKAARMGSVSGLGTTSNDGLARQQLMRAQPFLDDGGLRKYAYGGVQPHVARAGQEVERIFGPMPGGIGGVGARGNVSDHPSGLALDFMTLKNVGLGNQVSDHFLANSKKLLVKYIIWQQRINSGSGWRGMEDRGSPTANHADHPHVSFLPLGGSVGANFSGEGSSPIMTSLWEQLGGWASGLFNGLLNFSGMPANGSLIGNAITQIPTAMIKSVIAKAQEMMSNMFAPDPKTVGAMGPMTGPVVDQVRAAAKGYGWDVPPEWDALARLIAKESSWNPTAQNPKSSAYGLFQFLDSTWAQTGIAKSSNPGLQATAGMRYIKSRYGTPSSALAFHNKNNYYDTGGMLMPGVAPINMSGEVERVLSPQQTGDFERLVSILEQLVGSDGVLTSSGDTIHLHMHENPRASAADYFEEANFKLKSVKRGGLYS